MAGETEPPPLPPRKESGPPNTEPPFGLKRDEAPLLLFACIFNILIII